MMKQPVLVLAVWPLLSSLQLLKQVGSNRCSNNSYVINVMLMNYSDFPSSTDSLKLAVKQALERVQKELQMTGENVTVDAIFHPFTSSLYVSQGCRTSTCEGVELIKTIYDSGTLGCAVIGPACTYATYQMVSYMNALDAGITEFSEKLKFKDILRTPELLKKTVKNPNRKSNVIIMCGSPEDVSTDLGTEKVDNDIVIILIDLFNNVYFRKNISADYMHHVLVLTLPPANYSYNTVIRDYIEMEDNILSQEICCLPEHSVTSQLINEFRNTTFEGVVGPVTLDEFGDIDTNLTVLYTSQTANYFKPLLYFNTQSNETCEVTNSPDFVWKNHKLPSDTPGTGPHVLTIAVFTLTGIVILVLFISLLILSLICLLVVLVLLISPTLGDMGIYMTDFDSNVQGQLNSFEFSKLTRSTFSFSGLCNLSRGAPYGAFHFLFIPTMRQEASVKRV
ncbi:hypothetical protein DUI87_20545 [Hirundo rustica rustica]|uniref:Receptor ligand binding region domain-containing protein n=1 Tax=Hirundo rustica rustica TaxID=333673 RepID=A0A3M0JR73_HIRRU|nr:hypothetical protein DUI87_20545 [Hirundo rustica rustica]